jgi:hypothetical protein
MFQAFVWEAGQRGLTAEKLSSCNGSPAQPPWQKPAELQEEVVWTGVAGKAISSNSIERVRRRLESTSLPRLR